MAPSRETEAAGALARSPIRGQTGPNLASLLFPADSTSHSEVHIKLKTLHHSAEEIPKHAPPAFLNFP